MEVLMNYFCKRKGLAFLAALLMICTIAVLANAADKEVKAPQQGKAIEPFPILSFVPPAITEEQLKLYKECNFTVLTVWPKEREYEIMKKHWNGNYILYNIWGDPNITYDDMIAFHPEDPQLVGYFLGDEPNFTHIDVVGKIADKFRSARPGKPCLVNMFPSYAGYQLRSNYTDYVIKYFEVLKPQYCALDNYPCFWFNVDRSDFYYDIANLRHYALKYNSRQIGFVQVYSSNVSREVSESDLAWQVNSFLAYGCKGLWYFNYRHPAAKGSAVKTNDPLNEIFDFRLNSGTTAKPYKPVRVFGSAVLDMNDKPSYAYPLVKNVNGKAIVWGKLLTNFTSVDVFHTSNSVVPGYNPYDPVGADIFYPGEMKYIQNVTPTNPLSVSGFIIAYFEDSSKHPYVMIVNKKHGEDITCAQAAVMTKVEFKDNVKAAFSISNVDGKEKQMKIENKCIVENIGGGEAIFLRLELANDK